MESVLIEQHKLITERCKDLINVSLDEDVVFLRQILNKSKKELDEHNNENLTVVDVTSKESGIWRIVIKNVIYGRHINSLVGKLSKHIEHDLVDFVCDGDKMYDKKNTWNDGWYYYEDKLCNTCKNKLEKIERKNLCIENNIQKIRDDFHEACNKTIFDKDLKLKYVLLSRNIKNHKPNPLETAIKETIHNEIAKTFQEQNEKLIIKYS